MSNSRAQAEQYLTISQVVKEHDPTRGYYVFRGVNYAFDPIPHRGTTVDNLNFHENWLFASIFAGAGGTLLAAHVAHDDLVHTTNKGWLSYLHDNIRQANAAQFIVSVLPENTRVVTDTEFETLLSLTPRDENDMPVRGHNDAAWRDIARDAIGRTFNTTA